MIGALSSGAGDLPFALLLILMVVGILLSGDDDLPGPRRSFARARGGASLPF
jgi:Sec-independent protein translocase protein TatA